VNDAPVQKHADVGMAMMGSNRCCHGSRGHRPHGCDGLGTIIYGIIIEIFSRMSNFIRYRANIFLFTFKLLMRYFYPDFFVYILNDRFRRNFNCYGLFFIAVYAFHPSYFLPEDIEDEWPQFYRMPVLMLMLVTRLND
jgi:H+-transporting ATPase